MSKWFLLGVVVGFVVLLFRVKEEGQQIFPGLPGGVSATPNSVASSCGCGTREIIVPSQASVSDSAPSTFGGSYGPGRPPRTFAAPAGTQQAPIVRYIPPQVPVTVQQLGSKP